MFQEDFRPKGQNTIFIDSLSELTSVVLLDLLFYLQNITKD